MKRILFTSLLLMIVALAYGQTTYYWVGENNDSINVLSNWNTVANGTGTARSSNTNTTDILVFDAISVAGNPFTVGSSGAISCAQMRYLNGSNVNIVRTSAGGTTVITMAGEAGDDFFVDATSKAGFTSVNGSVRIDMAVSCTGKVNGEMRTVTVQQFRITNTTTGAPGTFVFTSGSKFYTNITGSSSYAFGSSAQASEGWVVFEPGSELFYDGGNSPHGSGGGFSAIDMRPGSIWHHRSVNGPAGNFFNRKIYGDIIVENNATLTATGSIYRIGNLTINTGCSFVPATSGQTVITGNLVANGDITLPVSGTNRLVMAGSAPQTISGTGAIAVGNFTIADNSIVSLAKSIDVNIGADIYGRINFGANQLTGAGASYAAGVETAVVGTGNLVSGRYFITGNTTYGSSSIGRTISGTGIAVGTSIVSFSTTGDSMYLSLPLTATASGVTITATNHGATLETGNSNGFNPVSGAIATTGNKIYGDSINYVINTATTSPFGITTGSPGNMILVGFAEINAAITTNTGFKIHDYLTINGKITLRPLDLLHIAAGSTVNGTINSTNYIATGYNAGGDQSTVRYDGLSSATTLPIGTTGYYMPVTITPTTVSDFSATVFEGITTNGAVTGTALTATQKLTVVNSVWNINRLSGSGDAVVQLLWDGALEGSTFTTLPGTDIGLIMNNGSSWNLPVGTGDNAGNTVTGTVSNFGAFSAGAVPQVNPFVFNSIPVKTYGDPDFNGGATSLNTTQPIIYTSDNTAVATIVAGDIHIVGAGSANITASQVTDGFYPAASVTQALVVNKAPLTIKADNKTKFEGQANPTLTATYTGLVYSETPAALLTPVVLATTAVTASPPGVYPITVSGATSNNYDITFQNGTLTVQAKSSQTITFNALPTKTYGNADFNTNATSSNNTIPITYASSNAGVATVNGTGVIHITGAGTTTITASQAGNAGYFPAADVARTLTVNKVNLTVRVLDTSKVEGTPNPPFTMTYTGFVLGETVNNLTTQPVVSTAATTNSLPGNYVLTPGSGVSQNYNFVYVTGRMTIYPLSGRDQQYLTAYYNNDGNLVVRVYSTAPTLGDIVVFDMNGRPVAKKNLFMPVGFIQTEVYVPTIPAGIYVVTVRGNGVDLKTMINIFR